MSPSLVAPGARRSVAASLDATAPLLPHLHALFADLTALGSTPRRIVRWLGRAGIGPRSRVLDLGCGKGAVAVEAARTLGSRVRGIDAYAPFIAAAAALAQARGVSRLCTFQVGDLRAAPRARADAALMLAVMPVDRAIAILRPRVRPGGLYVVDDAILLDRRASPARSPARPTRAALRALLAARGDRILREHVMRPAEYTRHEAAIYASIARRAAALRRARPDLAPALRAFLRSQRQAAALLADGPWRGAMWLIRRARA